MNPKIRLHLADKSGKCEAADRGTIFLDEIGELPLMLQVKILRVLQEREIDKVGDTRPVKVDVRVIAATNRDLEKMIADGTFRDDLYYRLAVVSIRPPPLRERTDDIPLLFDHLLDKHVGRLVKPHTGGVVAVHPNNVFHDLLEPLQVQAWQVLEEPDVIRVLLAHPSADIDTERLSSEVARALEKEGAHARPVHVERVDAVIRTALGKAPLVKAWVIS